jgi:hypothetical protein
VIINGSGGLMMTELKLHEAFRILRERGITDMKVGLPELAEIEGPADLCAVYSLGRPRHPRRDFYFCVDAAGSVLGGREAFDQRLKFLPARRKKVSA